MHHSCCRNGGGDYVKQIQPHSAWKSFGHYQYSGPRIHIGFLGIPFFSKITQPEVVRTALTRGSKFVLSIAALSLEAPQASLPAICFYSRMERKPAVWTKMVKCDELKSENTRQSRGCLQVKPKY